MATVRVISKAEAQQTKMPKPIGPRRQRMNVFDEYVAVLRDSPTDAIVIEEIEESPQQFIVTLRGAFQRAGMQAAVRKMRGRNEVRAWLVSGDEAPRRQTSRPKRIVAPKWELAGVGA